MILAVTLAVAVLLAGAGLLVERALLPRAAGGVEKPIFALTIGWALMSLVGALCALLGLRLPVPMAIIGLVGLVGIAVEISRADAGRITLAWLVVLPLLIITALIAPTMPDEFTHWLPNIRYLVEHDGFPNAAAPNLWSDSPGYPPGLSLIGYAVERLAGSGFELAPKIFNVLIAAGFGLALASFVAARLGSMTATAIGVAAATVFNPFFDPRIALTSYADTPSAFGLGLCLLACWRAVETSAAVWRWRVAATAVAVVLLRETNAVLIFGLACGLVLTGRRGWSTFIVLVVPAFIIFLLWRVHLWVAAIPPFIVPRPFAEWNWGGPITVVSVLFTDRLSANAPLGIAAFAVAGVLLGYAVWVAKRSRELRSLYLLLAATTTVWIAFLAWDFMAVASPEDLALARSAWRFLSELGPAFILVLFASVGWLWSARARESKGDRAADFETPFRMAMAVIIGSVVWASTLATWRYWKIDCRYPAVTLARLIAQAIAPEISPDAALHIFHPDLPEGYARIAAYELHRPIGLIGSMTSKGAGSNDSYLIDISDIKEDRLGQAGDSPTMTVTRWDGAIWRPMFVRSFQPSDFTCRLW